MTPFQQQSRQQASDPALKVATSLYKHVCGLKTYGASLTDCKECMTGQGREAELRAACKQKYNVQACSTQTCHATWYIISSCTKFTASRIMHHQIPWWQRANMQQIPWWRSCIIVVQHAKHMHHACMNVKYNGHKTCNGQTCS